MSPGQKLNTFSIYNSDRGEMVCREAKEF
jgi:hypothetical protein